MIKISIIMPVYNAEEHLEESIDSILNQEYKNIELIVINDGSSDSSLKICKAYEQQDERVIVIDKDNTGVSDTRNTGLSKVSGDYITFVDSDDLIEQETYTHTVKHLEQHDLDILEFGFYKKYTHKRTRISFKEQYLSTKDEIVISTLTDDNTDHAIWNKLYKREVVGDVKFPKYNFSEDFYFNIQVALRASTKLIIEEAFYNYRQVEGSLMNSAFSEKKLDRVNIRKEIIAFLNDTKYADYSKYISLNLIKRILLTINEIIRDNNSENDVYLTFLEEELNKQYELLENKFIVKNANYKVLVSLYLYRFNRNLYFKVMELVY